MPTACAMHARGRARRAGADPFAQDLAQAQSALHYASQEGHAGCIAAIMGFVLNSYSLPECQRCGHALQGPSSSVTARAGMPCVHELLHTAYI